MNNNPLTETQSRVLGIIAERSKDHPVTGAQLSRLAGMTEKLEKMGANLRSVVNTLRDKGYPICAGGDGYYYPQSPEELTEYILSFNKRIEKQQMARDSLVERCANWISSLAMKEAYSERPSAPAVQTPLFPPNGRMD